MLRSICNASLYCQNQYIERYAKSQNQNFPEITERARAFPLSLSLNLSLSLSLSLFLSLSLSLSLSSSSSSPEKKQLEELCIMISKVIVPNSEISKEISNNAIHS